MNGIEKLERDNADSRNQALSLSSDQDALEKQKEALEKHSELLKKQN
jgi:hypothetical protein